MIHRSDSSAILDRVGLCQFTKYHRNVTLKRKAKFIVTGIQLLYRTLYLLVWMFTYYAKLVIGSFAMYMCVLYGLFSKTEH